MVSCLAITSALVAIISAATILYGDGKVRMYYPAPAWKIEDMPDMSGKVALVTGANTGLGYETALELMKKGCEVIIATRSPAKGAETLKRMQSDPTLPKKHHDKGKVPSVGLSLGSQKSVKAFAAEVSKTHSKLDVLVNNAGIMMVPFELSEDGQEMHMAVNHFGHYSLTLLLMPLMKKAGTARVVTVSSAGHNYARAGGIDFAHMNDGDHYDRVSGYGQSKLANILFASALSAHAQAKGIKLQSNSAHPGAVHTDLARNVVEWATPLLGAERAEWLLTSFSKALFMTSKEGATTQLFLATAKEAHNVSGEYYVPTARLANSNPLAFDMGKSKLAGDAALAEALWKHSAKVTGLDL